MALIVCTACGKLYEKKNVTCPFCNNKTSITKDIEKIILNIKNTRKGSRGFKDSKIVNEICEATGMDREIAKKFLENMEHPYGKQTILSEITSDEFITSWKEKCNKLIPDNMARCPRCKSTSISYDTKKLSVSRGVVGGLIAGTPGMIMGGLSSKKGYAVCLNCGKRWKI